MCRLAQPQGAILRDSKGKDKGKTYEEYGYMTGCSVPEGRSAAGGTKTDGTKFCAEQWCSSDPYLIPT